MKKVLMIGYCNKYFRVEYAKNIGDDNVVFDILSFDDLEEKNIGIYNRVMSCDSKFRGKAHALLVYIKMFFYIFRMGKYDAIHIHSLKKIECIFASILRKKCKNFICSMYGSDFYRSSTCEKSKYKKVFEKCDYITITTQKMTRDFNAYYNDKYKKKVVNVSLGSTALENIRKNRTNDKNVYRNIFGIPEDSFVCTVGYNATKEQHHVEILKNINTVKDLLPKNFFVVIPLGYGDKEYGKDVKKYLENSNLEGTCLFEFYDDEAISKLRLLSNVMIQLQDTDMLSGSMLEYIYADNVVITGAWLEYGEIEPFVKTIKDISSVSEELLYVINNYDSIKMQIVEKEVHSFIEKKYMWKNLKKSWQRLYGVE